jgi:hypothetical protein
MSTVKSEPSVLEYGDYVNRLRSQDPGLAAELADFHGIEQVLQWSQQRGCLAKEAIDLVGQDEFSYDFLLQLGTRGRWLAFGVN